MAERDQPSLVETNALADLDPAQIGPVTEAIENILPAIRALACGGQAHLTQCASMYTAPPMPYEEVVECMYGVRVIAKDPTQGEEFLDLDELGKAIEGLTELRERWLIRAGSDAFVWRRLELGE